MVLDYNKLLVKRSNIVVYSSLQSPSDPPELVCLYYIVTRFRMLQSNFPLDRSISILPLLHVVCYFFRLSFLYLINSKWKDRTFRKFV